MKYKKEILAKDIMTKNVISVFPETSILEASEKMTKNGFNGLPVIDRTKKVIGIITEYDLLTRGTALHLPTFIKLFTRPSGGGEGDYLIEEGFNEAMAFSVQDVMNPVPLVMREDHTLTEIVQNFGEHHRVNPIPIVNASGILTGIVSRYDIVKFYAEVLKKMGQEYKKRV